MKPDLHSLVYSLERQILQFDRCDSVIVTSLLCAKVEGSSETSYLSEREKTKVEMRAWRWWSRPRSSDLEDNRVISRVNLRKWRRSGEEWRDRD